MCHERCSCAGRQPLSRRFRGEGHDTLTPHRSQPGSQHLRCPLRQPAPHRRACSIPSHEPGPCSRSCLGTLPLTVSKSLSHLHSALCSVETTGTEQPSFRMHQNSHAVASANMRWESYTGAREANAGIPVPEAHPLTEGELRSDVARMAAAPSSTR